MGKEGNRRRTFINQNVVGKMVIRGFHVELLVD